MTSFMNIYYKTKIPIMKAMSRVTSEGLPTWCLCLDVGLALSLLGVLPSTHFVVILCHEKKFPIILKSAMTKLIPIECNKIINAHIFPLKKPKSESLHFWI